jgi:transposase
MVFDGPMTGLWFVAHVEQILVPTPWWMAAPTFVRWVRLGVWERLLSLVQERGVQLGMTFLDGTNVRAHKKAAGARRKGALKLNEIRVKHLAALVVAMAPRLV